jgi:protein gp37
MGEQTKIQWAHHTFNPWMGCSKVHAGCTACYAEKSLPVAMRPGGKLQWGEVWQGGQRVVKADSGWRDPLKWARDAAQDSVRRRVFCASLADVLEVPAAPPESGGSLEEELRWGLVLVARRALDAARARLWDTIRKTACAPDAEGMIPFPGPTQAVLKKFPGLDWLLLTKRPENWHLVPEDVRPLVWLGTSISDQKTADEWVPRLLAAKGFRLRFLSVEPMVGPVNLSRWLPSPDGFVADDEVGPVHVDDGAPSIGWVIVGGESGSKARPLNVEWVRDIVRQFREAGVRCFVKQMGARPVGMPFADFAEHIDPKGGEMSQWPEDIQVREVPGD